MSEVSTSHLISIAILALGIGAQTTLADTHQAPDESSNQVNRLCNQIRKVKTMPLKANEGGLKYFKALDPVYGRFRELGDAMVPCLIRKVTEDTEMADPSQAPHYGPVAVGDVAFWIFSDITGIPWEAALPPDAWERFKQTGRFGFLDWVRANPDHRKILQARIREWYSKSSKTGQKAPPS